MAPFAAKELVILVALAGNKDKIPGAGAVNRLLDRSGAIVLDAVFEARGQPIDDVAHDGLRRFAARIVVGDDGSIRCSRDGLGHQRSLAAIPIAAAAEYADELACAVGTR